MFKLRQSRNTSPICILSALLLIGSGLTAQTLDQIILINASTNLDNRVLTDGDVINLATEGSSHNIRASVNGTPGSVRFTLSGQESDSQIESVAPYALKGDNSGNYNEWTPTLGNYTLLIDMYSGGSASGTLLDSTTLSFSVIDQADATPRSLTVTDGLGSGNYAQGASVNIVANSPPSGKVFDQWTGDTGGIAAVLASDTTLIMPAADITVAATYRVPAVDGEVLVHGDLQQWHAVILDLTGPTTSETATPNPFLDYRFNVTFTGPSGQTLLVPGYFAGDGGGGDGGNIWRAYLNPDEIGQWSYTVSFRQGSELAVDLDAAAGVALSAYDGLSGTFSITASDKTGDDFRAPSKGMLVNRGDRYLTYGGSGEPFLYTGPGIPENILGYRGFTNTTVGIGHEFIAHISDWNFGDPDWGSGAGRGLIGALNYIAAEGGNAIYMMSNTVGGDGKDVFMHLDPTDSRDRYDNLKLDQWDLALSHAQAKGIFLHWHLAEVENNNKTYYGATAIPTLRKLYFRMLVARFGHYNALKWNLMEETTWEQADRRAQMAYLKAIDPYDHPVTFQMGGAGLNPSEFLEHLGEPDFDSLSFQGNASNNSMWDTVDSYLEQGRLAGVPWTVAWDEPQKIENDLTDEANGYPSGRHKKMWPSLMAGGDGFMWYIQQDGGGHGFDQRIEDFSIMGPAFNWSRHVRTFLQALPLLEMESTRSGLNEGLTTSSGVAYMLFKTNEVYALYRPAGTSELQLDLTTATGSYNVTWFNPREGTTSNGSVVSVTGGTIVGLGSAPTDDAAEDWAILVEPARKVAYIYGDIAADGTLPSGSAAPYDQMLLTDPGDLGLSDFKEMVEDAGFSISQYYDQATTLDLAFLNQFEVIVFGLHQKLWSSSEKAALDTWLHDGGGMLIYSDSAAGGRYNLVGAQNPVGQTVVNNLIRAYGMEVTVDQANGIKAYRPGPNAVHPITIGRPVLEGEGVSPIAVDPNSAVERLIPYEDSPDYKVSGNPTISHLDNLSITDPEFAALALARVGDGRLIAMFDRQPMWDDGPGSDIQERDNLEVLRRILRYLGGDLPDPTPFTNWQAQEFGADVLDPSISGPDADPNGDGIRNLLAYAADLPGLANNTIRVISLPLLVQAAPPTEAVFTFRYRRATGGAAGIDYSVLTSTTLATDSWSPVDFFDSANGRIILAENPDGDGSAELVEVTISAAGRERLFARLEVSAE